MAGRAPGLDDAAIELNKNMEKGVDLLKDIAQNAKEGGQAMGVIADNAERATKSTGKVSKEAKLLKQAIDGLSMSTKSKLYQLFDTVDIQSQVRSLKDLREAISDIGRMNPGRIQPKS